MYFLKTIDDVSPKVFRSPRGIDCEIGGGIRDSPVSHVIRTMVVLPLKLVLMSMRKTPDIKACEGDRSCKSFAWPTLGGRQNTSLWNGQ